ncbi:MAG: SGNH/GDSL hydrolase family protein [Thermoplasmata archaeon]|nr:SGNH/GDSL hydrolase family protein [Thermoplasmata archaeon]
MSDAAPSRSLRTGRALKIVGLGDSTTAGTPGFLSPVESPPIGRGNPESQYAFWVRKLHPEWTVLNRGVNRERTDEVLRRLTRDALDERPDYLIVLAGVNDVYQGRPLPTIRSNLDELYRLGVGTGANVIAATVLPFDSMTRRQASALHELNDWIRGRANELGFPCAETGRSVSDPHDRDRLAGSPDGLHPDVAGYRKMGEALAAVIEEVENRRAKGGG